MNQNNPGEFEAAQRRAQDLFTASLNKGEPPIHRSPHTHPKAEETYAMSLPLDMVLVDIEFADWFTLYIPFPDLPQHGVVLKREFEQLRGLVAEWARGKRTFSGGPLSWISNLAL